MLSWKEKVANKLSRLLADSRSSSPSPSPAESPMAPPEPQAFFPEEFTSTKKSSLSSSLSDVIHSKGANFDESGPTSPDKVDYLRISPVFSPSGSPKADPLSCKDSPSDKNGVETDFDETKASDCNTDQFQESYMNGSHGLDETSIASLSCFTEKSAFISVDLFEFFKSSLPNIVKDCQWVLLYSTWKHGTSLRTLIRRSVDLPGPSLLIVGDTRGTVFGGLVDSPLKPTAKRKYQGTNQTFVFTTIDGEPRIFKATGANRYYYMCVNDVLAFGGGGNFALALEEDLLHGSSGPCETFGNSCLAHSTEFELKDVELWGFTHSSQYLT